MASEKYTAKCDMKTGPCACGAWHNPHLSTFEALAPEAADPPARDPTAARIAEHHSPEYDAMPLGTQPTADPGEDRTVPPPGIVIVMVSEERVRDALRGTLAELATVRARIAELERANECVREKCELLEAANLEWAESDGHDAVVALRTECDAAIARAEQAEARLRLVRACLPAYLLADYEAAIGERS